MLKNKGFVLHGVHHAIENPCVHCFDVKMYAAAKWCEALSAVGPKCKKSCPPTSGENFDLEFRVLIIFIPQPNLIPRLLRDSTGAPTES